MRTFRSHVIFLSIFAMYVASASPHSGANPFAAEGVEPTDAIVTAQREAVSEAVSIIGDCGTRKANYDGKAGGTLTYNLKGPLFQMMKHYVSTYGAEDSAEPPAPMRKEELLELFATRFGAKNWADVNSGAGSYASLAKPIELLASMYSAGLERVYADLKSAKKDVKFTAKRSEAELKYPKSVVAAGTGIREANADYLSSFERDYIKSVDDALRAAESATDIGSLETAFNQWMSTCNPNAIPNDEALKEKSKKLASDSSAERKAKSAVDAALPDALKKRETEPKSDGDQKAVADFRKELESAEAQYHKDLAAAGEDAKRKAEAEDKYHNKLDELSAGRSSDALTAIANLRKNLPPKAATPQRASVTTGTNSAAELEAARDAFAGKYQEVMDSNGDGIPDGELNEDRVSPDGIPTVSVGDKKALSLKGKDDVKVEDLKTLQEEGALIDARLVELRAQEKKATEQEALDRVRAQISGLVSLKSKNVQLIGHLNALKQNDLIAKTFQLSAKKASELVASDIPKLADEQKKLESQIAGTEKVVKKITSKPLSSRTEAEKIQLTLNEEKLKKLKDLELNNRALQIHVSSNSTAGEFFKESSGLNHVTDSDIEETKKAIAASSDQSWKEGYDSELKKAKEEDFFGRLARDKGISVEEYLFPNGGRLDLNAKKPNGSPLFDVQQQRVARALYDHADRRDTTAAAKAKVDDLEAKKKQSLEIVRYNEYAAGRTPAGTPSGAAKVITSAFRDSSAEGNGTTRGFVRTHESALHIADFYAQEELERWDRLPSDSALKKDFGSKRPQANILADYLFARNYYPYVKPTFDDKGARTLSVKETRARSNAEYVLKNHDTDSNSGTIYDSAIKVLSGVYPEISKLNPAIEKDRAKLTDLLTQYLIYSE